MKVLPRLESMTLGVLLASLVFVCATACGGEEARKALPTKQELAKLKILTGWKLPWEMKGFKDGAVQYEAFPSEEAYYAASELDQMSESQGMMLEQINAITADMVAEMKDSLVESMTQMEEHGISSLPLFPSPPERVTSELLKLAQENKLTKASFTELFNRVVAPMRDASEVSYAIMQMPQGKDDEGRAAAIEIKIYLYKPEHVQQNPTEFSFTTEEVAELETRSRDFYKNIRKMLNAEMGEDMEEDLEELLSRPSSELNANDREKIADLTEGLDVLDSLEKYPHKVASSLPDVGDQCVELCAVYTFPEAKRASLLKASAGVGTLINTLVRQGSAVAHLKLTTNDNAYWNPDEWRTLVHLVSEKLKECGADR
ncbi:MAG: hypothetical protein V2A76_17305 [Planctomycetota bacterium]